jgi:hypothetical protein
MPRIAPDEHDVLVITLTDDSSTFINYGTAGTPANWSTYGEPLTYATGLLEINGKSNAIYIPSSYLVGTVRNGAGGANNILVTPNVSLSGWVFLRRTVNFYAEVFNKQYFLNGWSSPYFTFGFEFTPANNGELGLYITLNGVLQTQLKTPGSYLFPSGRWCHLGGTWDGTTLKMYINGVLVDSRNYTGTIDYGSSNRGQWYVGGIPGSNVNGDAPIIVQDIRVADIARPQSYFANIYYNGFIP